MNKQIEALKLADRAIPNLLWAATERDKKNRIRGFDDAIEQAREALAAVREALAEQQDKPEECAYGCPENTVCDYCQGVEPVKRPQNCGTGYCSCIECPYEPVKQEPVGVVESNEEWGVAGVLIAGLPIGTKLYAAPVDSKANAKERYDRIMAECEEPDPIERLRFFCSLAMTGKNWIDVEEFFDDLIAERKAIRAEALEKAALIVDHILKAGGGTYGDVIRGLK